MVERCEGAAGRFALHRKGKGVVPILQMVKAKKERHFMPLCSTEGPVVENILLVETMTDNYSSVLLGDERKRQVLFKLCRNR